ncbi:MAG: FAD binding domain-containing protein [Desulfotalea sp.]
MKIQNYMVPTSLIEAEELLGKGGVVLGGCGYLRLAKRKLETAIDLSKLGLDTIVEQENNIEIGAMVTLRELETNPIILNIASGVLGQSVGHIVGIQLRNLVTIGGSVMGRYPFSDPITALLSLDAKLVFQKNGEHSLEEYLQGKGFKDILLKIKIPVNSARANYQTIRKSATDYPILNVCTANGKNGIRIVVGARPGRSMRATKAEQYLQSVEINQTSIAKSAELAADELKFSDNPRGSGEYRRKICPVLVSRSLEEVLNGN